LSPGSNVAWDDDALYLGAELTGNEIWAHVSERDDVIFRDNDFEVFIASLDHIVLIEVPKQIRSKRVRDRSYQKFGDRILPGGDLYDIESKWFSLTDSRPDTYVTDWLKTVNCPVIRIDGTLPVENNLDYLVSVLSEGVK